MSVLRKKHEALVSRILDGDGRASRDMRRSAFNDAGLQSPMQTVNSKVAKHAYMVTDADIAGVRASGVSEDTVFAIVVSAAVGQATRQYNAALDLATEKE